jgi:hypothetical protein
MAKKTTIKPLDLTADIMAFEAGELDHDEVIALFQSLIDTGMAWQLQGSYGRTAADLIRSGECQSAGGYRLVR